MVSGPLPVAEVMEPVGMTLDEFWALPEGPPDYEFENGEVIPLPRATAHHQDVLAELSAALRTYVRANGLGRVWPEVDVELPEDRVVVPDLVFLAEANAGRLGTDGKIHGAPDLVVEILSPKSAGRDTITKLNAYHRAGIPWYWIVDPSELSIVEYQATADGYFCAAVVEPRSTFRPRLFPGLEINLRQLMAGVADTGDAE